MQLLKRLQNLNKKELQLEPKEIKKTWNRGRKKATPEQKELAQKWQRDRTKITNMVARDNTLDKKCCICGKENSSILHNKENPYYIAFLCKECRKNKENIEKAEQYKFDLQEHKAKQIADRTDNHYLDTRKFTPEEVKEIIEGYDRHGNILTFGEYAEKHGLSRHQFNQLQERYIEYFPNKTYVIEAVHNRSKAIQRNKLSQAANDRNLQLKVH